MNSLNEFEPEFVDSKLFCVAARKIALQESKKWWMSWDQKEQLICILTCVISAQPIDRIRAALEKCDGEPNLHLKKNIISQCKKWNLVLIGKIRLHPFSLICIELIMGYLLYHTKSYSSSQIYKGLGIRFGEKQKLQCL
ncbi:putative DNA (cytosine-5-)-methyltransferase [Helianthus annuus]|nr:putative DNA (cytosine-5-)-methyltransferase [Helianthus annuus]KAJ0783406.1 putative DNA (cytosine-5-)-methyltransferase [Helianthus annuus]